MYLPLTDLLTCPGCGPEVGLILLADRIEDRRVLEGALGCPRCQERFPVTGGFADLRRERTQRGGESGSAGTELLPRSSLADAGGEAGREEAIRVAALLGIMEGAGYILLVGPGVVAAPALAALLDGLEVVAIDPSVVAWPEERGVSRLGAAGALPLYDRSMRGVALSGAGAESLLEEAARVLAPGGRLLLEPASAAAVARAEAAGLQVRAREGEVLVALRA